MRKPLRESKDSSVEVPGCPSWEDWRTTLSVRARVTSQPVACWEACLSVTAGDGPGSSRSATRERCRPGA